MGFITVCYANDKELLSEVCDRLATTAETVEEPSEVEAPATLNLDPATIAQSVWQALVVFGSIKASLEAMQIIAKLLPERKANGRSSKIEIIGPSGAKVILEGRMTPEEVSAEIKRFETALSGPREGGSK